MQTRRQARVWLPFRPIPLATRTCPHRQTPSPPRFSIPHQVPSTTSLFHPQTHWRARVWLPVPPVPWATWLWLHQQTRSRIRVSTLHRALSTTWQFHLQQVRYQALQKFRLDPATGATSLYPYLQKLRQMVVPLRREVFPPRRFLLPASPNRVPVAADPRV